MHKSDEYIMRWSGWIKTPKAGKWTFKTRSDDGSMLFIDEKLIVDNDGLHGPRSKTGSVTIKQTGWHKLCITFFENHGGSMLQVSVAPPSDNPFGGGVKFTRLTAAMTKPGKDALRKSIGFGTGLHFEAFHCKTCNNLKAWGSPLYMNWNNMKPFLVHAEHAKDVWYSNDREFIKEIPRMHKSDEYIMRWSGWIKMPKAGKWTFKTRSDDGSMLYIDEKLVVDNDGLHAPRSKTGS